MHSTCSDLLWRRPVLTWLEAHVPPRRLTHILGVEQTAVALAERFGLDPLRAGRAGLLHDLAKYYPGPKLLAEAVRLAIPVDPVQEASPHLLHAEVSAALATELFDERDPEVLSAIANHTLGTAPLTALDQVLYVADWIEPNRRGEDVIRVREAAEHSLLRAVLVGAEQTILEVLTERRLLHPRTVQTRNWALTCLAETKDLP